MERIIKAAIERGASDIHIKAGDVFRARIDGELQPLTKQRLTPEQTKAIVLQLIPSQAVRGEIDTIRDFDCTWGAPGIGRFRVNILRQRSSFMVVMRVIPFHVPTLEKLSLPTIFEQICDLDRGLVLVTGETGSGKSSTVAAIIHQINATRNRHMITLESPIEFLHRDLNSSVTQREVGVDTPTYVEGLRSALRQDPDVVVVEELVNAEVVDVAMKTADTGRLVISTLHAQDVTASVARLIGMYPPETREIARVHLADNLQAIASQQLLQQHDGQGRTVALEVMVANPAIRDVLRDRSRAGELYGLLAEGQEAGTSWTFEQHLASLVEGQVISDDTARAAARNLEEYERLTQPPDAAPDGGERREGQPDRRKGARDRRRRGKTTS
jgi:twitching motility protein PilT